MNEVIHGDCLIESGQIASGSVDLILTDPPYGNMDTDGGRRLGINGWDLPIEPKDIYTVANRILRKNGKMILFAQEPYTTELINGAIPNLPFSYRAIWEKDSFANGLGVNKNMVGFYEDILVFSKCFDTNDLHPLRNYLKDCKTKSGLTNKQFNYLFSDYYDKQSGCRDRSVLEHYWAAAQFMLPTKEIYEEILQPTGHFLSPYNELKTIDDKFKAEFASTFNLWEGKKYKSNILKYAKDYDGFHPTQKPVALLEDLIKTFSNEGDLVVDLTAGSGSTAVACNNTGRNYIMIEQEQKYIDIINKRIAENEKQLSII